MVLNGFRSFHVVPRFSKYIDVVNRHKFGTQNKSIFVKY